MDALVVLRNWRSISQGGVVIGYLIFLHPLLAKENRHSIPLEEGFFGKLKKGNFGNCMDALVLLRNWRSISQGGVVIGYLIFLHPLLAKENRYFIPLEEGLFGKLKKGNFGNCMDALVLLRNWRSISQGGVVIGYLIFLHPLLPKENRYFIPLEEGLFGKLKKGNFGNCMDALVLLRNWRSISQGGVVISYLIFLHPLLPKENRNFIPLEEALFGKLKKGNFGNCMDALVPLRLVVLAFVNVNIHEQNSNIHTHKIFFLSIIYI